MSDKPKLTLKERISTGLIFAIVGTAIMSLINYLRGAEFTILNTVINLILFMIVGILSAKKKKEN